MFHSISIYKLSILFRESSMVLQRAFLFASDYDLIILLFDLFVYCLIVNKLETSIPVPSLWTSKIKAVCVLFLLLFVICSHEIILSNHW